MKNKITLMYCCIHRKIRRDVGLWGEFKRMCEDSKTNAFVIFSPFERSIHI